MKTFQDVAKGHQIKIAVSTLKMPDAMVGVMGGMDKAGARKVLRCAGWSVTKIQKLEEI